MEWARVRQERGRRCGEREVWGLPRVGMTGKGGNERREKERAGRRERSRWGR